MSAYDELKESNAWSSEFNLPTVPAHLNPHIYCAYAVRVLESLDEPEGPTMGETDGREHSRPVRSDVPYEMRTAKRVISTFPGGATASSHDDLYGAAFLDNRFAVRAIERLDQTDGVNMFGLAVDATDETKNVYRFFYVRAALQAFAKFRIGWVTRLQYSAALLFQIWFTKDGDTSGLLLHWLSLPALRADPMMAPIIDYWAATWAKRGYTPKSIFTKNYLTECPWFAKYARDDWN